MFAMQTYPHLYIEAACFKMLLIIVCYNVKRENSKSIKTLLVELGPVLTKLFPQHY